MGQVKTRNTWSLWTDTIGIHGRDNSDQDRLEIRGRAGQNKKPFGFMDGTSQIKTHLRFMGGTGEINIQLRFMNKIDRKRMKQVPEESSRDDNNSKGKSWSIRINHPREMVKFDMKTFN